MDVLACVVGDVAGMRGPGDVLSFAFDSRLPSFDARGAFGGVVVVFKRAKNRPLKSFRRARGNPARSCGWSMRIAGCMLTRWIKYKELFQRNFLAGWIEANDAGLETHVAEVTNFSAT